MSYTMSLASVILAQDIPDGYLSDPNFSSLGFLQGIVSALLGLILAGVIIYAFVRLGLVLFTAAGGDKSKAKEAGISAVIIVAAVVAALNFTSIVNGIVGFIA